MAEEIDDSGFYRQDFSTVSNWEIFNAQLGDVIQKLNAIEIDATIGSDTYQLNYKVYTETFLVYKAKICVSFYYSTNSEHRERNSKDDNTYNSMYCDLMNIRRTFGPPLKTSNCKCLHVISSLFGLQRFAVIHPHQSNQKYITNPSEFCFFLSAATVVASEYNTVPIFVQIYQPKLNMFLGVGMNATLRTNFDIVVLKQSPGECRYLSGLLQIFKEKLPFSNVQPISLSVRNIYALETIRFRYPMNVPFLKRFDVNGEDGIGDKYKSWDKYIALPCGYFPDSGTDVYLVYSWVGISEIFAIDSPLHTDFIPSKAHICNMYQTANVDSYLTSCLRDFLKLYNSKEALETFVGRNVTDSSDGVNMADARYHLTNPSIRQIRSDNKLNIKEGYQSLKKIAGPLNESELKSFIAFMFPDLYPDNENYCYINDMAARNIEDNPRRIKSSPFNSLSSRVSCALVTCNAHFGGKNGLAQLWIAFIRELRFIWNCRLSIQGISGGFPDTRTCLLNQKLQMLNYCIERSKCRKYESKKYLSDVGSNIDPEGIVGTNFKEVSDETGNETEDEFFDCTEYVPEGRAMRLGDENILDSDEPLYIPITQDPVPKTEDELQADAEAMLKLGSGFKIQMMSFSLLSDMEAFKAANPKGKMEDFIRWYSPKDWEKDEFGVGQLSARMRIPGNTWQTVWKQAQPVAANKQKRLFDETTEALKVLSYLETRNIAEIYDMVIITVLHSAIIKFKGILETEKILDLFEYKIEALLNDLCHISRADDTEVFDIQQTKSKMEGLIKRLEEYEVQFYQYKCFEQLTGYPDNITFEEIKCKFKEMIENQNSCSINNAEDIGKHIITSYGSELHSNLVTKEYVLRVRANELAGPHFLRAVVTGEEVRLCGAFTENTTLIKGYTFD
uniref:Rab3 GTPase-activating protein catalytic subunit n=3 Tax=Bactrocera latifrons TaxID=174628 RepID=A0A0K8UUP4_BACLA